MQQEQIGLCPDLVVCPAGLPHAQGLRVRELPLEAQQNPAVAEEQLEPVLPEPGQVLVEARQHESQQLPQIHLQEEKLFSHALLLICGCLSRTNRLYMLQDCVEKRL